MPNTIYVSQTATTSGGITFGVGDDSRSAATAQNPLTPLLTLNTTTNGAIAKATAGDTIIINNGTYDATGGATNYIAVGKTLTLQAATPRTVTLQAISTGNARVVNTSSGDLTLSGLVIDCQSSSVALSAVTTGSANGTLTIDNCELKNGTTAISGNVATCTILVKNGSRLTANLQCINNATALTAGYIKVIDSYVESLAFNSSGSGVINAKLSSAGPYVWVKNSFVKFTGSIINCACIYAGSMPVLAENNTFMMAGTTGSGSFVWLDPAIAAVAAEYSVIRNNVGIHSATNGASSGYFVKFGNETTGASDSLANYPIIYGNVFSGTAGTSLGLHGIFLGFMKGGCITNNVCLNAAIPFISKGQTERAYWVNNGVNNMLSGASGGLRGKGTKDQIFAGNTIILQSLDATYAFQYDENGATVSTNGNYIANNVRAPYTTSHIVFVGTGSDSKFRLNNYNVDGVSGNPFSYNGTPYTTIPNWITGQEATALTELFTVRDYWAYNKVAGPYGSIAVGPAGGSPPWGA